VTEIANPEQAAAWNGDEGAHWAAHADRYDASVAAYNEPLFAAAGIRAADAVLDIGCGCGQTTLEAARRAPGGQATGVDLSGPMLAVARSRAAAAGLANVSFVQADAQVEPLGDAAFDVAVSRCGAMFFGDLAAAFANIAHALRPGGHLALIAWTSLDRNEWLTELRRSLAAGRDLPAPQPGGPGPFSLGDPGRTTALLQGAGFRGVDLVEERRDFTFGADAADAFGFVSSIFPVRGLLEPLDTAARAAALGELRATIERHAGPGGVRLGSSAWLITATRA
jgi:SAM-dependent methyltransferase